MPCRHSRKAKVTRNARLKAAKMEMQRFRDLINANPHRKGAKLPRVK